MFDKLTEWKLALTDINDTSPSVFAQHLHKRATKETQVRLKAVHAGVKACKLELYDLRAQLEAKRLDYSCQIIAGNPASTAKEVNLYFAREVRKNIQRYHELKQRSFRLDRNKENQKR